MLSNKPPKTNKTSKALKDAKNNTKNTISNTVGLFSSKTTSVKNNIKKEIDDVKKIDFKKVPKKFYLYFIGTVIVLIGITIAIKFILGE